MQPTSMGSMAAGRCPGGSTRVSTHALSSRITDTKGVIPEEDRFAPSQEQVLLQHDHKYQSIHNVQNEWLSVSAH